MALPGDKQLKYWGIAAAIFLILLIFVGNMLTPFVIGCAIAYFLDPVADRLEAVGFSRAIATATITLSVSLILIFLAVLVIPEMMRQIIGALEALPAFVDRMRDMISMRFPELLVEDSAPRQALDQAILLAQEAAGKLASSAASSFNALFSFVFFLLVVPVVAFYMLLDWDRMVAAVDRLLPRDHAPIIRQIAQDIDRTLANFVRGQGTVMLILGTFYAVSLGVIGLNFGLVIGATAGLVSFIPYVGAIVGGVLSIGVAIFQYWSPNCVELAAGAELAAGMVECGFWNSRWMIAVVAAVFFIGKVIEDNILTPLLVGNSVGLHPVWLMLGLTVFGSAFGFIGLLVAVPLAAVVGVLVRYGVGEYLKSRLYLGFEGLAPDQEASDDPPRQEDN